MLDAAETEIQKAWTALQRQWPRALRQQLHLDVGEAFVEGGEGTLFLDGRRAEICYVLYREDPQTGLLLHTKSAYPAGCFRLPTGGVKPGENVVSCLAREVLEETSLELQKNDQYQFLGQLDYLFKAPQFEYTLPFTSYVFTARAPMDFRPQPLDETEEIEAWLWQPAGELGKITERLLRLRDEAPNWSDWGRFRAPVHKFVHEHWVNQGCPTPIS